MPPQGALGGQAAAQFTGEQRAPGGNQERSQKSCEPSSGALWDLSLSLVTRSLMFHGDILGCEAHREPRIVIICLLALSLLDCEPLEVSNSDSVHLWIPRAQHGVRHPQVTF